MTWMALRKAKIGRRPGADEMFSFLASDNIYSYLVDSPNSVSLSPDFPYFVSCLVFRLLA